MPTSDSEVICPPSATPPEEDDVIPVQYEGLTQDLQPGDRILIDDGQVVLSVLSVEVERAKCSVVVGGVRTPFCRAGSEYAELGNLDLLATVLTALAGRYDLATLPVDEVWAGAVMTHSKDWNLAREAVLSSPLAPVTPAVTLPIFDSGRLRANLAASEAGGDIAIEQYNAALVDGLHEVADALASARSLEVQQAEQRTAQASAEEALRLANLRYREGLSNYLTVLSAQTDVLAQRLVRTLCPACKVRDEGLTRDAIDEMAKPWRLGGRVRPYRAVGCADCRHTGFKGRAGLYELMQMSEAIKPMIKPQLELKPLRKQAAREGMVPLRLSGLMKVAEGLTTLDEVLKATPPWNN